MSEPTKYHFYEINLWMAQTMVNGGQAGFYSYRCQAPIAHPERMCIFAQDRWWLVENAEFNVEDRGIAVLPQGVDALKAEGWMRAHTIEVDEDHPIARLLLLDAEYDNGPDTVVPVSKILPYLPEPRLHP